MKNLIDIIEGLKIGSKTKVNKSFRNPKDWDELRDIIRERLEENKDANLNDIDVSDITDMGELFWGLGPHNIDISKWDVSNVKYMSRMFEGCTNFNSNISDWDVSNVVDMSWMFNDCKKFNCDLSKWDVSNVIDMFSTFYGCKSLKKLPKWYKE